MAKNTSTKSFSPPKFIWKRFDDEFPPIKQYGCYLLWNDQTGEGTTRSVHAQTNHITALPLWAATYTHWAYFRKPRKRDCYGI